jgi:hypothetical protein
VVLVLLVLLMFFWVLIQTTWFQNYLVARVTKTLSKELNAKVSVKHVDFRLFNKMLLEGALVLDQKNDTLLYAGTAKLNITDWFFFKDKVTLNYVGLDDAVINLNRTDSVWNYQFLVDYFSGTKKTTTKKDGIELDLDVVELNNVRIFQQDKWKGQNMLVGFGSLDVTTDVFDSKNKRIVINSIKTEKPVFSQYNYTGNRPKDTTSTPAVAQVPISGLSWNPQGWNIQVKSFDIVDGILTSDRFTERQVYARRFDGQHLYFSSINGAIRNINVLQDSIFADVDLASKERSGFEVRSLKTKFKMHPQAMEFTELDLQTPHSRIGHRYVMQYEAFNRDMSNFIHAVRLDAGFTDSRISSKDLAFFAPATATWQRNFDVSGNVRGTIDNLTGRDLVIEAGGNNYLRGNVSLRGLPDINETYIDLRSNDLRTTYNDLALLIPAIRRVQTPRLDLLGNIRFIGNFTGFVNDFVTFGIVATDLGTIESDLNMKLTGKLPVYSGAVKTTNFRLGDFLGSKAFGNVTMDGTINGVGFKEADVNVGFDGSIDAVEFNGYNYQNILAKGTFGKKLLQGTISVDDPNLKLYDITGSIDLTRSNPQFNFDADVAKLNAKALGFTKDDFSLTGRFNMNFSGNNIDNFLGSARIYNAQLKNKDQQLSFDSLTVYSSVRNGRKYLSVHTNELDANVDGTFSIAGLPDAFQLFLNRYYPAYINKPKRFVLDQDFNFSIKTRRVADYLYLIDKNLKGFDLSTISGKLNLAHNSFDVNAFVPAFQYGTYQFTNVELKGIGNYDSLSLTTNVENIVINDSLSFPGTRLKILASNDVSDVSLTTSASKTLTEADLSARIQTFSDGFRLSFNPSSFVVNDKRWTVERGGELSLTKTLLHASEVRFSHNDQQIILSTEPSSVGSTNDVLVELRKVNITDFTPFFLKTPRLEGLLSGNVRVTEPFNNFAMEYDARIDQFRFENDSVGLLTSAGTYAAKSGEFKGSVVSNNPYQQFIADISFRGKDSSENQLRGEVQLTKSSIHWLEKYLGGIFNNIYGTATGKLSLRGRAAKPKITGNVLLDSASMIVNYTRVRYLFPNNTSIQFNNDEINFGTIRIRDTLGNTATFTGRLNHSFFNNWEFRNLRLRTDGSRFVLLNTTPRDNQQFYGNVIGTAELTMNGPVNNMKMYIRGEPTDSSHIYLPTGAESRESGKVDYIDFVRFGREMNPEITGRQASNITVDMEVTANPFAKIDVILDESTKDIIRAQGNGTLNIHVGTREALSIRGRYDVQQGDYTFNFQTFLRTPFKLQQGFIEWQGDPYLANMNIDAIYRAEDVDLSNVPTSRGVGAGRDDIDIIFKLRGTLKTPRPEFEFQFPYRNKLKDDPIANEYLKTRLQADKNELNKQVTSLLLFNTFVSDQQSLISSNNAGNFVTRSLGQILSTTLSNSLNSWLHRLLKTDAVNVFTSINTSDFAFERGLTQRQLQNLGNLGIRTSLLKGRLLITVGGNLDYRIIQGATNANSNFLFTPDVSFEWLITPDGRFRVIGFNRSDQGVGDVAGINRRNRTGLLLSYRRDFDTWTELFRSSRKAAKEQAVKE